MYLSKYSSKEDILKYIEKNLLIFLFVYSDKPWAQPYIDDNAKKVAKEMPFTFLDFFPDKPWAQPYIDEAVKGTAKENPKYFLEHLADRFPQGIDTALFALGDKNGSE